MVALSQAVAFNSVIKGRSENKLLSSFKWPMQGDINEKTTW